MVWRRGGGKEENAFLFSSSFHPQTPFADVEKRRKNCSVISRRNLGLGREKREKCACFCCPPLFVCVYLCRPGQLILSHPLTLGFPGRIFWVTRERRRRRRRRQKTRIVNKSKRDGRWWGRYAKRWCSYPSSSSSWEAEAEGGKRRRGRRGRRRDSLTEYNAFLKRRVFSFGSFQ